MSHYIPSERWEAIARRPWGATWPADADRLLTGLGLLSAFRARVGGVEIAVAGDGEEAIAVLLGALAERGVEETALPDVGFVPFDEIPEDVTPISALPAALVAACRDERRPYHPAPGASDGSDAELWRLAAAVAPGERAIVVCESLAGAEAVASPCDFTCVSGSPLIRRKARRLGVAAIPPPPAARWLPAADVIVVDGRRPADLALAAASGRAVAIANGVSLNPIALEAFGLAAERSALGVDRAVQALELGVQRG